MKPAGKILVLSCLEKCPSPPRWERPSRWMSAAQSGACLTSNFVQSSSGGLVVDKTDCTVRTQTSLQEWLNGSVSVCCRGVFISLTNSRTHIHTWVPVTFEFKLPIFVLRFTIYKVYKCTNRKYRQSPWCLYCLKVKKYLRIVKLGPLGLVFQCWNLRDSSLFAWFRVSP